MLTAALLTLLAPLPGRAWYNPCDALTRGGSGNDPRWTSHGTDPGGSLYIYRFPDGSRTVMVARCTGNAVHAQTEKHRTSQNYPPLGYENTFTMDVKFPSDNDSRCSQTFFQVYEQSWNAAAGKWRYVPMLMVMRTTDRKLGIKFIRSPLTDADDYFWTVGDLGNDKWYSLGFRIKFHNDGRYGFVDVTYGPTGGAQRNVRRYDKVCHFGPAALKHYAGFGNYTFGSTPFSGTSNIDNVWIHHVW
jgi:hypothetical protein